ncbi:MAG: S1C family serine protease [Cellulomonadaceae bacterium]
MSPDERWFAPPEPVRTPPAVPAVLSGTEPGLPGPALLEHEAPLRPRSRPARRRAAVGPGTYVFLAFLAILSGVLGALIGAQLGRGGAVVEVPVVAEQPPLERPEGSTAAVAALVLPSVVSLEVRSDGGLSSGSGFVFSADGYIVTNNHVVAGASGADAITVLLADGSQEPATLVGSTVNYDLAVVRIERTGLVPLVLGDSDAVVVGDPVVAVGAPLGLDGTVTTGIVSALNRPVVAGGDTQVAFINALQTDSAINPGNSGGPLVDGTGAVVGVNSAIAQPPGTQMAAGNIGLGFAIPSNQVRRTVAQLIETGQATYPVIGVMLDGGYTGEGVLVSPEDVDGQPAVTPGGPGDEAGIRPGDVITRIDGRPVTRSDELVVAIRAKSPGDAVTLTVRPGGQDEEIELTMVLDEAVSE